MNNNTKCKFGVSGFTLIELLVVISIIALLLSILVPALGRAKSQAKTLICKTRQKTLGTALVLYNNEYNALPLDEWESNQERYNNEDKTNPFWFSRIGPFVGKFSYSPESADPMGLSDENPVKGDSVIWAETFSCTEEDKTNKRRKEGFYSGKLYIPGLEQNVQQLKTYTGAGKFGYNPFVANVGRKCERISSTKKAGSIPLVACLKSETSYPGQETGGAGRRFSSRFPHSIAFEYGWPDTNNGRNSNVYGPAAVHYGKINFLFFDGHVDSVRKFWPWDENEPDQAADKYFDPK